MKSITAANRFEGLGLAPSDFALYEQWVNHGKRHQTEAAQSKYLDMFKRLAAVLPVKDTPPARMFRAYRFGTDTAIVKEAKLTNSIKLRPRTLSSWSANPREAMRYVGFQRDNTAKLLAVTRTAGVVLYIGPKVRKFLGAGLDKYFHANDHELIVEGNGVGVLTPRNSIALEDRWDNKSVKNTLTAFLVLSVDNVIRKMRERSRLTDKEIAQKGVNINNCHTKTARAIRDRQNPTDIVWIYGDKEDGQVVHSVLTTSSGQLVVGGNFGNSNHKFLGDEGFVNGNKELLDLMKKFQAKEILQ